MSDEELWKLEEAFWTGGEDHYQSALDPACLMVFPGVGPLTASAALEGLKSAPRWKSVGMDDRRLTRPSEEVATLAYRARGEREGAAPYEAWCSSSYRRDGERWLLFQHQQTPV